MQADYSVELGKEDPALEFPWSSDDPSNRYYDVKRHPELVSQISETAHAPELAAFLTRINAVGFPLQTVKCDLWYSTELSAEEEIFAANGKFVAYVDLVFAEDQLPFHGRVTNAASPARRLVFEQHEALAKSLCALLRRAPEMAATVELVIRRCYYHQEADPERSDDGFCITTYVSGFGEDEAEARRQWSIALTLVRHALVQVVQR